MASKSNKEKELKDEEKLLEDLSMFDKAAKKVHSFLDNGYQDRMIIGAKDKRFRDILNRELSISKGYSHGSIVDFVSSLQLNKEKRELNRKRTSSPTYHTDLFTTNIGQIFSHFQEMYKSKFFEIDDLKFISKFIPALGEAVKTTLNALVASDNIAETVNRKIKLPDGISEEDRTAIENEIERIEKDTKLLKKMKSIVYKKTLVTGTHFVYAVPYNRIFEEYDIAKKQGKNSLLYDGKSRKNPNTVQYGFRNATGISQESTFTLGDIDISEAMESVREVMATTEMSDSSGKFLNSKIIDERMEECREALPNITFTDSTILSEAMESVSVLAENEVAMEAFKKSRIKTMHSDKDENFRSLRFDPLNAHPDSGTKGRDYKPEKYEIAGTYLKFIDPKNLVPLRVFEQTIGYYLIHPKTKKNRNANTVVNGITAIGNTLFSAINIGETKKHDSVNKIVDAISDGILRQFDKKFVTDNVKYKKLIADVIITNGLTDKDYNIQFIPADDIIPFTVQEEDDDGYGLSVLSDALFPAKLLLSMIVTRMLNYINKTGNKTVAHIHKGSVNAFDTNQLNRVIRDLQDSDITFNDLLSPNLVFNKFNRDGNMAIPTSKDGTKLVEFEIQEGQQIEMNPEYEQMLEKFAIMACHVPNVIMEYIGNVEFAKQIVSANIEFAGWIASLQSDVEDPTTTLYKKLVENSNLTDDQKAICAEGLEIQLPRPRVLINSNNNEYIQNIEQAADAIADLMIGRDSVSDENKIKNGIRIKEKLKLMIAKKDSPFIEWDDYESMYKEAVLAVEEESVRKDDKNSEENGGDMNF